jgi:hypothetical protein
MAKELRTYVHVADENGQYRVFGPGDDLPDWARSAITNPKAWADGEAPVAANELSGSEGEASEPVEPPRAGKGSGLEVWRDYAERLGWFDEIPADASRDDIVASIDAERARRDQSGE